MNFVYRCKTGEMTAVESESVAPGQEDPTPLPGTEERVSALEEAMLALLEA